LGCGGYAHGGYGCVASDGSKKVEVGPEKLVNPSSLGMCYDNGVAFGNPPSLYGSNYEWVRNEGVSFFPDSIMHNGGLNLMFSDAHAEWTNFDNEEYWFKDDKHWVNK
jgi:prepilin-type processing-associated H-X9-DG protein